MYIVLNIIKGASVFLNFASERRDIISPDVDLEFAIGGTTKFDITLEKTKKKIGKRYLYKIKVDLEDYYNFHKLDYSNTNLKTNVKVFINNNFGYKPQKNQWLKNYYTKFTTTLTSRYY